MPVFYYTFYFSVSAQYLSLAMLSNLVAVLWSVYVVRAWTRPGEVSNSLARVCRAIAPILGLTKKTYLCNCTETFYTDSTSSSPFANQNGDTTNNGRTSSKYKECEANEATSEERKSLNGPHKEKSDFQACKWHLVLDIVDRIFLICFCLVMVVAILVLFIILPYIYGKIFV